MVWYSHTKFLKNKKKHIRVHAKTRIAFTLLEEKESQWIVFSCKIIVFFFPNWALLLGLIHTWATSTSHTLYDLISMAQWFHKPPPFFPSSRM
jgi:hypothetical protein